MIKFRYRFVILSLAVMLADIIALAGSRDYPRAEIKVAYNWKNEHLRTDGKAFTDEVQMILLANPVESKFFNMKCEYIDSLRSTPAGHAQWRKMMNAAAKEAVETGNYDAVPAALSNLYVFKSSRDSAVTVFDRDGSNGKYYYFEPLTDFDWHIGDSTKTILGYECILAETDFRGRHWTVWFAPEIPVHDGPWKLRGLPGLILEASESSGQNSFVAEGIERTSETMRGVYNRKNYKAISRIEALKALRKFLLNGDRFSHMVIQNTPDGSKVEMPEPDVADKPDLHVDFLETDYHD